MMKASIICASVSVVLCLVSMNICSYLFGYSIGEKHGALVATKSASASAFEAARLRCFIHWHDAALGQVYGVDPN